MPLSGTGRQKSRKLCFLCARWGELQEIWNRAQYTWQEREREAEEDEEEKENEEKVSLASEVRKGIWLFDAPNAALGVPNQVFIVIYSYL